jgi:hypothetical protein
MSLTYKKLYVNISGLHPWLVYGAHGSDPEELFRRVLSRFDYRPLHTLIVYVSHEYHDSVVSSS